MGIGTLRRNYEEDVKVDLSSLKISELKNLAKEKGIEGHENLKKEELVEVLRG